MAARAALGSMCRRLWQVPGGLGVLSRLTGQQPRILSARCRAGHLEFSPDIYSASWRVVCRKVARKGPVLLFQILSWNKTQEGKDGNKKNRSMLELERMLNNMYSKALLSDLRNKRKGSRSFSINSSKSSTARNGGFLLSTSMKWVQFSSLHVDIPKDLTKPTITISDEPDTLYKRLSVLVKGHDKAVLDSYEYFAVLAAKELGISIKVHEPPRKIERFTLLKSVHIFKKHRVQYEMRTLYRCLELEHLTGSTADVYLEYIQRNLPEGVAMEVTKTKLERLPEHIKEPIWEMVPEEKAEGKS